MKASVAIAVCLFALSQSTPSAAQAGETFPVRIPAPGGEVAITSEAEKGYYRDVAFAPVRRAGDFVFVSGDIAGPQGFENENAEGFREQARRTFRTLQARLEAEGATFADVVWIHSFHVFHGVGFSGGKTEQINIFMSVKNEFVHAPYPAWTAVGVQELFNSRGVVEVEMMAYAPRKEGRSK